MPHISHPARQDDTPSVADWLRYHIGIWMQERGADLEHRALYPNDIRCHECGGRHHRDFKCDGIPF